MILFWEYFREFMEEVKYIDQIIIIEESENRQNFLLRKIVYIDFIN